MKAVLQLELFGEDTRIFFKIVKEVFRVNDAEDFFDRYIGMPPRSSWVAEVTGPDETYGLSRKFLKPKLDYSKSNAKGSRGIFAEYILETGKFYEVKSQETWKRIRRFFCVVTDAGDVTEVSEETACHAIGALTYAERREKYRAEKLSGNQRS